MDIKEFDILFEKYKNTSTSTYFSDSTYISTSTYVSCSNPYKLKCYNIIKFKSICCNSQNKHYIIKHTKLKNFFTKLFFKSCDNYVYSLSNTEINMPDNMLIDTSIIYTYKHKDNYTIIAKTNGYYITHFIAYKPLKNTNDIYVSKEVIVGDLKNNKLYSSLNYENLKTFIEIHKLYLVEPTFQ
jgi:hypothetical protein